MSQHIVNPLLSEEFVRILRFAQSLEKHGQVVMVIQLFNVHFPPDSRSSRFHRYRQLSAYVIRSKISMPTLRPVSKIKFHLKFVGFGGTSLNASHLGGGRMHVPFWSACTVKAGTTLQSCWIGAPGRGLWRVSRNCLPLTTISFLVDGASRYICHRSADRCFCK